MTALLWLATLTHQLVPRAIRRVPAALPRRRRPLCSSAGDPFLQTCPPAEQLHVAGLSYDLETTGLGPGAEIVQIAVHVANSAKSEPPSFDALVLPSGPITPDASAVHGLTRQRLEAAGAQPFGVVWQQIEAWLGQTLGTERPLVWCAHNGQRGCIKGLHHGLHYVCAPSATWTMLGPLLRTQDRRLSRVDTYHGLRSSPQLAPENADGPLSSMRQAPLRPPDSTAGVHDG